MAKIINQAFEKNWAFYNADCVAGTGNPPDNSANSPLRFTELYIYNDKDKRQTKHPTPKRNGS
jgi:hypothetical protein